jgi:putative phosphoesterase
MSNLVKVGIISDTHHYIDPRIVKAIQHCDMVVHAGDIGCAAILQALEPHKVIAVRGNNDYPALWAATEKEVIDNIPEVAEIALPNGKLVVEHGHQHGNMMPDHASLRQCYPDARIIVYGHSHKMVCDQASLPWVINPGAAGRTRTHGGASCLILTASMDSWSLSSQRYDN